MQENHDAGQPFENALHANPGPLCKAGRWRKDPRCATSGRGASTRTQLALHIATQSRPKSCTARRGQAGNCRTTQISWSAVGAAKLPVADTVSRCSIDSTQLTITNAATRCSIDRTDLAITDTPPWRTIHTANLAITDATAGSSIDATDLAIP